MIWDPSARTSQWPATRWCPVPVRENSRRRPPPSAFGSMISSPDFYVRRDSPAGGHFYRQWGPIDGCHPAGRSPPLLSSMECGWSRATNPLSRGRHTTAMSTFTQSVIRYPAHIPDSYTGELLVIVYHRPDSAARESRCYCHPNRCSVPDCSDYASHTRGQMQPYLPHQNQKGQIGDRHVNAVTQI